MLGEPVPRSVLEAVLQDFRPLLVDGAALDLPGYSFFELRDALALTIPMFWESARPEVSAEDWADYERLTDPESADYILNLPDYYAFLTYTVFTGRVPG